LVEEAAAAAASMRQQAGELSRAVGIFTLAAAAPARAVRKVISLAHDSRSKARPESHKMRA
jgi:hypothetical protein